MTIYAWAANWNVSDGSLTSIVSDLTSHNGGIDVVVRSQPVNRYPIRRRTLSGKMRGDGRVDHTATVAILTRDAMEYIQDTYLSGGTVASAKMTVRLRQHDLDEWKRFNCWFSLYNPANDGDYELGEFRNVQLRFLHLTAL